MEKEILSNFESMIAEIRAEIMRLNENDNNTIDEVKSLRAEMIQMKSEHEIDEKMNRMINEKLLMKESIKDIHRIV
jgi:hypothetical protein